jgi:hypothetical protein
MAISTAIAGMLAALGSGAAVPGDEALLGPMSAQLRNRVGTWCVEARLQFTPQARPILVEAVAESRLLGERWLVTELRGMDGRGGFQGIGVNGYDPALGRYTGYWVDSTRALAIPVDGEYDSGTGVFRTVSTERRAQGGAVTVTSETRSLGPDEEVVRFVVPDAEGRPFERMVLRYRRTGTAADCPRTHGAGSQAGR